MNLHPPEGHTIAGFAALLALIYFTGERMESYDPLTYAQAACIILGTMGGTTLAKAGAKRLDRPVTQPVSLPPTAKETPL